MPTPSGEPLTKCPICRYDLTGLPASHRCPECGFEYDETTVVWYAPRDWWTAACLWGIFLFLAVGIAVDFAGLLTGRPELGRRVFSFLFAIVWLTLTIAWTGSHPFVAATRKALVYGSVGRTPRRLAWTEFWMPEPGSRAAIPPWRTQATRPPTTTFGRMARALSKDRGVVHRVGIIFLKPSHPRLFPYVRAELPLGGMSRRWRFEVMKQIYQRWRDQNAAGTSAPELPEQAAKPANPQSTT
jgi:hypothetical protein